MVAEAEAPAKSRRKVPLSPGRGKGSAWISIPQPIRLRIRSLYVVQGLDPAQIAPQLGKGVNLTPLQISTLCHREGWVEEKRKVKAKIEKDAVARTREQVDEIVEATAMLAEEGSISGLQRAVECTTKKSKFAAKDFASWANGARALVQIARQARGLESDGAASATNNLIFIGALDRVKADPTPAAKCIDVATTPALPAAKTDETHSTK